MLHYHGCEEEILTVNKWHAKTVGHIIAMLAVVTLIVVAFMQL